MQQLLPVYLFEQGFFKGKDSQQRHGYLGDHQDHGYRPEFAIAGDIFHEKLGKTHKIFTPRQHDSQDGYSQDPPSVTVMNNEHTQHKKKYHDGTHVNRTHSAWLFAPVKVYVLDELTCKIAV